MPVYDSDSATKKLYHTDYELKKKLIETFGEKCYFENGQLNKTYLGKIIFGNKTKLQKINDIVHPRVQLDFDMWLLKHTTAKYVIKEAAILIESGAYKKLDKIIMVSAPIDLRVERTIKRDNSSREKIIQRVESQLSEGELAKYADYIITNNEKQALFPQILKIHDKLLKL
jgi:dephospho-CoA kinase